MAHVLDPQQPSTSSSSAPMPMPMPSSSSSSSASCSYPAPPSAASADGITYQTTRTPITPKTPNVAVDIHRLSKMLQLHGYCACREALVLLEDHFASSTKYESMEDFISKLNRTITFDTNVGTSIIDPDLAHLAIQILSGNKNANANDHHQSAGDAGGDNIQGLEQAIPSTLTVKVKNVQFDTGNASTDTRRPPSGDHRSISGANSDKEHQTSDFNIHYNFLFKRLNSLPIFQADNFRLMQLSKLTASSQPSIRCICLGLLVKNLAKIDEYMLIDSTGRIPVRVTPDTAFRNRLAYTNCIVLVEGVYINPDDVLFAANIGLPPILLDPICDKSLACVDEKLVVILRDLYLDEDEVCNALDMLFTGYNSMEEPPILFILIGDFTRHPCSSNTEFRSHMKKLIRIIRTCDNLVNSHFVFVPGLHDTDYVAPPPSTTPFATKPTVRMPKPSLTKEQLPVNLLELSNITNVHLATNPTHIYLDDRQISIVSHSYLKELNKYLLHDLSDHREELFDTAKLIMLSNGHLTAGVSKLFKSSMSLWHRPDLLILADTEALGNKYDYNSSRSSDTSFATVPSFSRSFYQFKVYCVNTGEIDDSQVSPDAYEEIAEGDDDAVQEVHSVDPPTDLDD